MPEQQNPEHQLEYLKELRAKYEEALKDAEKSGDYTEAKKLKEELDQRLTTLEALFPKPEAKAEPVKNNIENEEFDELAFQERAMKEFDNYFVLEGVDPAIIAENLSCFSNDKAKVLRTVIAQFGVAVSRSLLMGLAGVDNENAWQLRDSFEIGTNAKGLLQSLAGIDSSQAWEMRKGIESYFAYVNIEPELIQSLTGLDSSQAWIMREKLQDLYKGDVVIRNQLLQSLAGIDSKTAWEEREGLYDRVVQIPYVVTSVTGIDSEKAWGYREAFKLQLDSGVYDNDQIIDESILARSLAGIDSERAWDMRKEWINTEKYELLAESLAGLNNSRAWAMRSKLLEEEVVKGTISKSDLISSINGDPVTAIGWRTAKKYNKEKEE